ncbi:hypothetical protein [Bosea sp. RAC05]|uniref:hypothetical protein n=1 Tax=Bosea sp. RAC05 TaxID=1842539 RepID=UPI00083E627E|nr:hypothetical protein [Bosea sp. RAC05]AOG03339.1 hypothetical protein BSY19_4911 [Bosea sp. RAC05]
MSLPFTPEERQAIEKEFDRLIDILEAPGRRIDRIAMMKDHHRSALAALRVATGRRLSHSEIAPLLLSWARANHEIRLYAQRIALVHARSLGVDTQINVDPRAAAGDFIASASKSIRGVQTSV